MKDKIKTHFLTFRPKKFVIFTILTLLSTDLINCKFLQIYWKTKNFSKNIVDQTIIRSGQVIEDFSSSTIKEMTGFVDNSFYFFLFIIIVNNLFFYLFYLRRKLWAHGFIQFYVVTSAILQLSFLFDRDGISNLWLVYNILLVPIYAYIFLGVKYLKNETTGEIKNLEQ